MQVLVATCLITMILGTPAGGAPKPVPSSPYLPIVYRYADSMLRDGRDTYGPQKTGLLLSALDRTSISALKDRPEPPRGILQSLRAGPDDGPLVGANPQYDQNLLRVLYTLSELSGKPIYRDAADAELKWFLENWPAQDARPTPWEGGAAWNVVTDRPIPSNGRTGQHPAGPGCCGTGALTFPRKRAAGSCGGCMSLPLETRHRRGGSDPPSAPSPSRTSARGMIRS